MHAPMSFSEFSRVVHMECSSRGRVLQICEELQDNLDNTNYRKKIDAFAVGVGVATIFSLMRWEKKAKEFENLNSQILIYPDSGFCAYNAGSNQIEIGWCRGHGDVSVAEIIADWDCGEFANSFASLVASFGVEPELMIASPGSSGLWVWEQTSHGVGDWIWDLHDNKPQNFLTYDEAEKFIEANNMGGVDYLISHPC